MIGRHRAPVHGAFDAALDPLAMDPSERATAKNDRSSQQAKATPRNKCFTSVMAVPGLDPGIVPAIHVAKPPIPSKTIRTDRARGRDCSQSSKFVTAGDVGGRDKPGHDAAGRFNY